MDEFQPRKPALLHWPNITRPFLLYYMIIWSTSNIFGYAQNLTVGSTGFRQILAGTLSPSVTNTNFLPLPIINSTTILPEVSSSACPEYCTCSQLEVSCNGQLIFPLPDRYVGFQVSRLFLENFKKTDLRPADLTFVGLTATTQELRLPRNTITSLKNGLFTQLKGLKRLDLNGNKLSVVGNLTFIGLSRLTTLDLSQNRIATIEAFCFAYLPALIKLDLSSNKLTRIPSDLFTGLISLQYLSLEVNQIVQLHPRGLTHVMRLVHLNFAMNLELASMVEEHDFSHLISLQYCDFSHCGLQKIPRNLPSTIRDIRLTGNRLHALGENALAKYSSLAVLVMDDCNITQLSTNVFANSTSLQRLWMNGNGLRSVPHRLPSSLKGLYLDENNINAIVQEDLARLVDLEELRLQRNQIATIQSGAFASMPHLDICDLRGNRLQTLSNALFPPVNSISRLDLSLNSLRTLGADFFQHLVSLKQLDMSRIHVPMADLPEELFALLPHLTALDLSGSPDLAAKFLHEAVNHRNQSHFLRRLHSINLRACELTSLDSRLESFFRRIAKVKLVHNQFACTAENRWLLRMIQTDQKRFYRVQEIKCASPRHLKERKLIAIDTAHLETPRMPSVSSREHDDLSYLKDMRDDGLEDSRQHDAAEYSIDNTRIWVVTLIACLLTASVVSLIFACIFCCCTTEKARWRRSVLQKVMNSLRFHQDPFPNLKGASASNRTLYRSRDDSIFMIGTDTPCPPFLTYEELNPNTLLSNGRIEGIYENDALSNISTVCSSIRVRI